MDDVILKAENIHYSYDSDKKALKGVSLDIHEKERLFILGANGSGKSTFFLNINGVLKPERGAVYYKDRLIDKSGIKELRDRKSVV